MRIEKEIIGALSQAEGARSPFKTLYNKKTGKAQTFHAVDAREVLKLHGHQWSESPVNLGVVEDAVVVAAPPTIQPMKEEIKESAEAKPLSELTESLPAEDEESIPVRRRRK